MYETLKASEEFNFQYERKGLLLYYQSEAVGEKEWQIGLRAIQEGLKVQRLTKAQVDLLEPNMDLNIKGAVHYSSDAHMTPNNFMSKMTDHLKARAVRFFNEKVENFNFSAGKISEIITDKRNLKVDEVVLAAGIWSTLLAKKTGVKIAMQAGKGYRIDVSEKTGINMPAILCEAKVAITPMSGFTRFAGTMEIGGIDHKVNWKRVVHIANAAKTLL